MVMATDLRDVPLRLVRDRDGLSLDLRPLQGLWTTEQYLQLTDHTRHLVEFTDGRIEVLSMPTQQHQLILGFLYRVFFAYLQPLGGLVLFAALRLQIRPGVFREPDLLLVRDKHDPRTQNRYWLGADLVIEIVSPDDPERDTVEKVVDYAAAGIAEYWIVNPLNESITILQLDGTSYTEHGRFGRGSAATSALFVDLSVSVDALFDER